MDSGVYTVILMFLVIAYLLFRINSIKKNNGFKILNLELKLRNALNSLHQERLEKNTYMNILNGVKPYKNSPQVISRYNRIGNIIEPSYSSLREAEKGTGISRHRINMACRTKRIEGSYYYRRGSEKTIIINTKKQ